MAAMKDKDKKPDDKTKIVLEKISSAVPGDEDGEEVDEEQEEDEGMHVHRSLAARVLICFFQRLTPISTTSPWEVIMMLSNTSTMARTTARARVAVVTTITTNETIYQYTRTPRKSLYGQWPGV